MAGKSAVGRRIGFHRCIILFILAVCLYATGYAIYRAEDLRELPSQGPDMQKFFHQYNFSVMDMGASLFRSEPHAAIFPSGDAKVEVAVQSGSSVQGRNSAGAQDESPGLVPTATTTTADAVDSLLSLPFPGTATRGAEARRRVTSAKQARSIAGGARNSTSTDSIFLDAVVFLRVQKEDLRGIDFWAWVKWMLYAGVEKIYMYDTSGTFSKRDGRVRELPGVAEFIAQGVLIIYNWLVPDWHKSLQRAIKYQMDFYADSRKRHPKSTWRMYLDSDEFVFALGDTESSFLVRYLRALPKDVAAITLLNTVYGGIDLKEKQRNVSSKTHARPQRYVWRWDDAAAAKNTRKKYVAHMQHTCSYSVHSCTPCGGYRILHPRISDLRFNHFWGPRVSAGIAKKYYIEDASMLEPFLRAVGNPPSRNESLAAVVA